MTHRLRLAALAAVLFAAATPALASNDASFLRKAMQGDNSEMRLGRLAEQQGHSSATRRFGRTLAIDHAAARRKVIPVARSHGVAVTTSITPEARSEYAKLRRMRGWAFDREFARYMVNDHRKDISDFDKQARRGDRSTCRLALHTLPTLRKHLRLAESLSR